MYIRCSLGGTKTYTHKQTINLILDLESCREKDSSKLDFIPLTKMKQIKLLLCKLFIGTLFWLGSVLVNAEDPYLFYTWTVTYGTRSPLGVPKQV